MNLSDFGITKHIAQLPGGTPLIFFERKGAPISIQVGFRAGSMYDPLGHEGLAHFCEHIVASGNEKFPTREAIGTFIDQRGAYFNASTGSDMLRVLVSFGDPSDLRDFSDFLRQLLTASIFSDQTIEKERGAIHAELGGKQSNPGAYIGRLYKLVAYQNSPIGRDTLGTDQSLDAIDRQQLINYYTNMLVANRAGIVVSGGLDFDACQELLSDLIRPAQHSADVAPDILQKEKQQIMVRQYPGSSQTHLAVGFESVNIEHPDYWPLLLLTRIMGRGRTSRLYRRLRLESGLVYGVAAYQSSVADTGRWSVTTDSRKSDLATVLSIIAEEFVKAHHGEFAQQDLELVQMYFQKSQRLQMDSSMAWTDYHLEQVVNGNVSSDIVSDRQKLAAVSLGDIRRVAKIYIKPNAWCAAACGDLPNGLPEFQF